MCGRQAIDGDTAQVGPQVAEKLNLPQITYAENIVSAENGKIVVVRRLERGVETVSGPMPMVVTVNSTAPECRPRNARRFRITSYNVCYTKLLRTNTLVALPRFNPPISISKDVPHWPPAG